MAKLPMFMIQLTASVPEDVYEWLQKQAAENGVSTQHYVFWLLMTAPDRKPVVVPESAKKRRVVLKSHYDRLQGV